MYPRLIALVLAALGSGGAVAGLLDDPLPQSFSVSGTPPAPLAATEDQAWPGLTPPPALVEIREQVARVPTVDLTVAPDDLWERIRRGFSMPDLSTDLVTDRQIYYINRPGALRQIFSRGQRYLYYIVEELERRGMPTELALLPMVESAFNPMALSPARASGLWQFIPSTGKTYKLEQNWWVDERRDVIASTNAALDYLQTIYEMHGDWQLALASYNWGEGAVAKAIARNRAAGLPTEYQYLNMPGETRYYVPKLQALKNIIAQPELFGVTLPNIPNRPYFVTIETRVSLDLATAARLAQIPVDEMLALNPGYKRPILPTNGSQSLVIPADRVDAFMANLERHDPASSGWKTYSLREGEGLEGVADRLGISASRLRQVNGLSPRARIGTGYTLIVPSDNEGDRISLAPLMPNEPQNGASEPQALIQRTVIKGRNGRPVVVERKLPLVEPKAALASRNGKGGEKPGAKGHGKSHDAPAEKNSSRPAKADARSGSASNSPRSGKHH